MTVQRCPSCFLINPPRALHCDCGHDFNSSISDTEDVVSAQVGPAQAAVAFYGLSLLVSLGFLLFLHGKWMFFALTIFCGVRLVRRAIRLAEIYKSLRELPRPPRATALKRRAR